MGLIIGGLIRPLQMVYDTADVVIELMLRAATAVYGTVEVSRK